jgi:hypothetical protein
MRTAFRAELKQQGQLQRQRLHAELHSRGTAQPQNSNSFLEWVRCRTGFCARRTLLAARDRTTEHRRRRSAGHRADILVEFQTTCRPSAPVPRLGCSPFCGCSVLRLCSSACKQFTQFGNCHVNHYFNANVTFTTVVMSFSMLVTSFMP